MYIALSISVGFVFLCIGILYTMLHPIAETSFQDNQKKRKWYCKFGMHRVIPSSFDKKFVLPFFTQRVFTTIFWTLLVASWLIGMVFTFAMVSTADICDYEDKNAVTWNLLDHWEETTTSEYGDVESKSLTRFWRHQLLTCHPHRREMDRPIPRI